MPFQKVKLKRHNKRGSLESLVIIKPRDDTRHHFQGSLTP